MGAIKAKRKATMGKLFLTGLTLAAVMGTAFADMARIDVSCTDKTQVITQVKTTCRHSNMSWLKATPNKGHVFQAPVTDEWTPMSFTITPEADGTWRIGLKGEYRRDKATKKMVPVDIYFDNLEISGAKLTNPSFEKVSEKTGGPVGWSTAKSFTKEGRHVLDPAGAKDGERYVKVWHNKSIRKSLKVTKGQPVTITAYVKKAK
jgi:hypothetical protein